MLEGEINEINLVERLVELWREQFTGAIRFENDGIIKIVYFKSGDVLSASTNDRADSVDEILMRAGKVSREHVKQALAKRKENETLGDALLNLGFITRKELTWARRVQVVGVIRSITAWSAGQFTIVADYLPKRDEGTLFPLPQVLVELIVTDQDRQKFERVMDGGSAVYAKAGDFDDVFRKLGLNEQAEAIVRQIDGTKSVSEVATTSGGETFNVYKLLNALATLRILNRVDQPSAQPEFALDDFASAGVADAADVWNEPPQSQPSPTFELDEAEALTQPTIEIQIPSEQPTASAWDEEEEQIVPEPVSEAPPERMPAWDVPPRPPAPPPIPAPVEPAADADEEQWGFDDAQLETVRRATTPPKASAPVIKQGGRRYGLIIALLVIAILAAGGWFGYQYWQQRQEAEQQAAAAPVRRPTPRPAPATPPQTMTIVEAPTTTTTTMAAIDTAATQTTPPPPVQTDTGAALPRVTPKPLVIAAAPAPEPAPSADGIRARYDAMAQQFAANPTGNFTVQVQILCEPSNVAKAMSAGGSNIWFVPQTIGARSCYRVFWGHYNTRDEAQRAMTAIPADLRDRSAAVKPVPKG
jgi:septal ring-binding cell division protein DamX